MVERAGILCPENKDKFENITLSCKTVTPQVELIDEDIVSELNKKVVLQAIFTSTGRR